jgi:hypothetical protein
MDSGIFTMVPIWVLVQPKRVFFPLFFASHHSTRHSFLPSFIPEQLLVFLSWQPRKLA